VVMVMDYRNRKLASAIGFSEKDMLSLSYDYNCTSYVNWNLVNS
jgi:hypothetical protein